MQGRTDPVVLLHGFDRSAFLCRYGDARKASLHGSFLVHCSYSSVLF